MINPLRASTVLIGLAMVAAACTDMVVIYSREPVCQPPAFAQNLVGTWRFVSIYSQWGPRRQGAITFNTDTTITDPDNLFEPTLLGKPVIRKAYGFKPLGDYAALPADSTVYFYSAINLNDSQQINPFILIANQGKVRLKDDQQISPFTLIRNQCNYIKLVVIGSEGKLYIELTR